MSITVSIQRAGPLAALEAAAILFADGHFTVMRFTTNWRVMLGTPADRDDITGAFEGATFNEAVYRLLESLRAGDRP